MKGGLFAVFAVGVLPVDHRHTPLSNERSGLPLLHEQPAFAFSSFSNLFLANLAQLQVLLFHCHRASSDFPLTGFSCTPSICDFEILEFCPDRMTLRFPGLGLRKVALVANFLFNAIKAHDSYVPAFP